VDFFCFPTRAFFQASQKNLEMKSYGDVSFSYDCNAECHSKIDFDNENRKGSGIR
jgi:hypothetical protein